MVSLRMCREQPGWACWDEPKLVWALWLSSALQCDLLSLGTWFSAGLGSAVGTCGLHDLQGLFPPKRFYNSMILSLLLWLTEVWSPSIRVVEGLHTWKLNMFFPKYVNYKRLFSQTHFHLRAWRQSIQLPVQYTREGFTLSHQSPHCDLRQCTQDGLSPHYLDTEEVDQQLT